MPEVWHFYVGFRSLPQKNCTIWTLSKGYGIWIDPYALFLLYRQIMQPKPKTKYFIDNVMAKSHLRSFAMPFFISSLLYTIFADLRSFLESKKIPSPYPERGKGWVEGFEPSASRATIWRDNQLRHTHHIKLWNIRAYAQWAWRDSNPRPTA